MIYSVKLEDRLGNIEFLHAETISIVEKLSEELDSGAVTIPVSSRATHYKRWSKVTILMDNVETGLILWGDKVDVVIKGVTPYYSHTLTLIEPTKILERVMVPSITFTQPLDSTFYTMADVIQRIIDVAPVEKTSLLVSTRACVMSAALVARLNTIDAPQFFIRKSNMREVFIQVLAYVNAVPRLGLDGVLDADFLNEIDGEIVIDSTIGYQQSASSEDYATSMESYVDNVIGEKNEDTSSVIVMSRTDLVGVRADTPIMGDSQYHIPLPYKINKVLKIIMHSYVHIFTAGTDYGYFEIDFDITNYLFSLEEYNTLDATGPDLTNRKSHAIWYEPFKGKRIDGLTTTWGVFGFQTAMHNIEQEIEQYYVYGPDPTAVVVIENDWYQQLYRITYIPVVDSRIHIEREDISSIDFNTVVQANARDDILDIQAVTTNIYGKLQRTGLDTIIRGKIHRDAASVHKVAQKTDDDYIITDVERVAFPDFIAGRYLMAPKFNRLSQFIGVDRKFRVVEVSQTDRVVTRNILYKEYIIIDTYDYNNNDSSFLAKGLEVFMRVFETILIPVSENINIVRLSTGIISILVPCVSLGGQSTIILQFSFDSPNSAGVSLVEDSGQKLMKAVKYTDDEGRLDEVTMSYRNGYYNIDNIGTAAYLPLANAFPAATIPADVSSEQLISLGPLKLLLDTAEILKSTLQYQILPGIDKVDIFVVGINLTTQNPLVKSYDVNKAQLFVWDTDEDYTKNETKYAKGTIDYTNGINVSAHRVMLSHASLKKNWAIADTAGNLYLAVNQPIDTEINAVFFNAMNKREGVIYQ